jgi:hypothetical protein
MTKIFLLCLFILASCATGHRETSKQLRTMVQAGEYEKAITALNESSLAKDEKSKLLYFLELGLLEHYRANYAASTQALYSAKEIADELYTVKVSSKIATALSNDNADLFYGEKYEVSLIHFYLALNHYMTGDLPKARSEIMAWDTFLTEMKNERGGKALFKEDLLAKTFGALVHEAQGTRTDDQVALQLYTNAMDVFFKNYNLFPSFNFAYEHFRKNYGDLPNLPIEEVKKKYIKETLHAKAIKDFLDLKILLLTKKIRPHDYKSVFSKLQPTDKVVTLMKQTSANITFLVQDGLIVEKVPRKYTFPMNFGAHATFALSFGVGNAITYELPTVEAPPILDTASLEAIDQNGKVVAASPLSVIAPVAELAEQAINEHSASIAVKTGTRLAAKHLTAFMTAYAAYTAAQRRNDTMGMLLATAAHAVAVAGINGSETADVRYWSTLPSDIRMAHLPLAEGKYKFRATFGTEGLPGHRIVDLGEQTVTKSSLKFVLDNKNKMYRSAPINLAEADRPIQVPIETASIAKADQSPVKGCMNDSECGEGTATGLLGGIGRNLSGRNETKGCSTDSDCSDGKVCATVRGEYPGWCAQR